MKESGSPPGYFSGQGQQRGEPWPGYCLRFDLPTALQFPLEEATGARPLAMRPVRRQPMTTDTPPSSNSTQDNSSDEQFATELAATQASADLEAIKASAAALGADALRELRAWIDSRLAAGKPPEAHTGANLSEQETRVLR